MNPIDIKVSVTEPLVTEDTLPRTFERKGRVDFWYNLGKPLKDGGLVLALIMSYQQSDDDPSKPKYAFKINTTVTIHSDHAPYNNCEIFYECIRRAIEDFNNRLTALKLSGYPSGKILPPSFEETLPRLTELYYPLLDQGLQ